MLIVVVVVVFVAVAVVVVVVVGGGGGGGGDGGGGGGGDGGGGVFRWIPKRYTHGSGFVVIWCAFVLEDFMHIEKDDFTTIWAIIRCFSDSETTNKSITMI